jgi:hypothetical protein
MIIPVAAVLLMLMPVLVGGRLARLATVRFRFAGWIALALLAQVLVIELLPGPRALLAVGHIASYAVAGWFLWANRRIPGMPAVAVGALANGLAIAVNGGTLPARAAALAGAGLDPGKDFVNSGVLDHPRLAFLGDVFYIPASVPLANVFSIGDMLIVLGAAWASFGICGTRWTPAWDAEAAGHGEPAPRRTPSHRREARPRTGGATRSARRAASISARAGSDPTLLPVERLGDEPVMDPLARPAPRITSEPSAPPARGTPGYRGGTTTPRAADEPHTEEESPALPEPVPPAPTYTPVAAAGSVLPSQRRRGLLPGRRH